MFQRLLGLAAFTLILGCDPSTTNTGHLPKPKLSKPATLEELNLVVNTSLMIPESRHARHRGDTMKPKFITIHSTQNYASSANARLHATALHYGRLKSRNNSLGFISWHYSVDQSHIYQSLPDNEAGQHADYDGPGNKYSIGIEMCENKGNDRNATMEHTARLIAYLMRKHRIPLENVVPHQHWRRIRFSDNRDLGFKNCPHFLMENGQPGPKWDAFKQRVVKYL